MLKSRNIAPVFMRVTADSLLTSSVGVKLMLMDRLKIAAQPWAKAVENASRLRAALTALTHFFNLPTTPASTDYAN
jgi:hypothetical protein